MSWCKCPLLSMPWYECPLRTMPWYECPYDANVPFMGMSWMRMPVCRYVMNVNARLGMQWMPMPAWVCNECQCLFGSMPWCECPLGSMSCQCLFRQKVFLKLLSGARPSFVLHPYFRWVNKYPMQCVMRCMIVHEWNVRAFFEFFFLFSHFN